jgi:hypothetical protein
MSDSEPAIIPPEQASPQSDPSDSGDQPSSGPNLTLIYSLIALALVAAIGLAMMIVLPFYQRR